MPTPKPIKQGDLQQVLNLRLEQETLKRQLKRAETDLAAMETLIIYAVDQGRTVERGDYACGVNEEPGRRVPKWKEVYAQALGPEAVEQVIRNTEPTPGARKLVVLRGGQIVKTA